MLYIFRLQRRTIEQRKTSLYNFEVLGKVDIENFHFPLLTFINYLSLNSTLHEGYWFLH